MYCTQCGTQNSEAANFCSQCGHQTKIGWDNSRAARPPRLLHRSSYDKKLGGVCSGLAEYFEVDVTLIRLLVVAATIFSGGIGILAYVAAWIIMPLDRGFRSSQQASPSAA